MIKWVFFVLFACLGSLSAEEPMRAPTVDPRLKSEDWVMNIIIKNEPKDNNKGYYYKVYEGLNEIIVVYERKDKKIKTISIKGEDIIILPSAKISIRENKLSFDSRIFLFVGGGRFGNTIY